MREAMRGRYTGFKKRKLLISILALLCAGMLFAPSVQAKSTSKKAITSAKVKLNKTSLKIKKDRARQLRLKNGSQKVTWKSSRRTVATVSDNGVVKAKKAGKCVITATSGGRKYQCQVEVYNTGSKADKVNALQKKYSKIKNKNKIIIAGSSSIERWENAATVLAPYRVLNMGIGGSTVGQWLKWYKELIVEYKPCAVILYPGVGNELKTTLSARETGERACRLLRRLHQELPNIPIFYVSLFCNQNIRRLWPLEKNCNEIVKKCCSETKNLYYIDVADDLINKKGDGPEPNVIAGDGEHMNRNGYAIWNKTVAQIVKRKLKSAESAEK